MVLAISTWWVVGWIVGFGGAVAAAALIVVIIRLAGRISAQARDITDALDGARANTGALFDVARTNLAVDRAARALRLLGAGREASR